MIWYVIENEKLKVINKLNRKIVEALQLGWGNGYVAVPPSHCLHGIDYDRLYYLFEDRPDQICVHGGITYSQFGDGTRAPKDWWVFGFDCMHWNDNLENWPEEKVIEETMSLFWQLLELEWGEL